MFKRSESIRATDGKFKKDFQKIIDEQDNREAYLMLMNTAFLGDMFPGIVWRFIADLVLELEYADSLSKILKRANLNHKGSKNYLLLAKEQTSFGDITSASTTFGIAVQLNPKSVRVRLKYGNFLKDVAKDFKGACVQYEKVLQLDEENVTTQTSLHRRLALLYEDEIHDYHKAKHHYEAFLNLLPVKTDEDKEKLASSHYFLAEMLANQLHNWTDARKHYERALQVSPDHGTHVGLGLLLSHKMSDYELAKDHFVKALEFEECADVRIILAELLQFHLNDHEGARKQYEKALTISNESKTHFILALLLHLELKEYDEADKHYKIAIDMCPTDPEIHYYYSQLLSTRFNDVSGARAHLELAISLGTKPEYEAALEELSHEDASTPI